MCFCSSSASFLKISTAEACDRRSAFCSKNCFPSLSRCSAYWYILVISISAPDHFTGLYCFNLHCTHLVFGDLRNRIQGGDRQHINRRFREVEIAIHHSRRNPVGDISHGFDTASA